MVILHEWITIRQWFTFANCDLLRSSKSLERHNDDEIMGAMASEITSLTIVYLTVYLGADQRKHKISESLAFARGIHRWPVNSPHKWPVTRKRFPFDDAIMKRIVTRFELWSHTPLVKYVPGVQVEQVFPFLNSCIIWPRSPWMTPCRRGECPGTHTQNWRHVTAMNFYFQFWIFGSSSAALRTRHFIYIMHLCQIMTDVKNNDNIDGNSC